MEVSLKNVSYQYQRQNKKVIDSISLDIKEGTINGILGKSGSGKTTLLELLVALRTPTEGIIKIGDYINSRETNIKNINDFRFQVGIVFQFPEEQIFNRTVREELELGMKFFNYKLDQLEDRVKNVLTMVGLDQSYLEINPLKLSNGEKRRVALASILIFNPKILILDEPTIGLDDFNKKNFIRLIKTLKQRYHKTIIIATHDTEVLHQLADYIHVLHDGKIVLEGDKYEVFKQEKKLNKYHIKVPKMISFANEVYERQHIKMLYRDEINDLIKDIYRYAR